MLDYLMSLSIKVQYVVLAVIMSTFVAIVAAFLYRFVAYGIRIKAGIVEIDATEENKEEVKTDETVKG